MHVFTQSMVKSSPPSYHQEQTSMTYILMIWFINFEGLKCFYKLIWGLNTIKLESKRLTLDKKIIFSRFYLLWMIMPFGLTNAHVIFMNLMNAIFIEYMQEFILVFMDVILVFLKKWGGTLGYLEKVFKVLKSHELFAKKS